MSGTLRGSHGFDPRTMPEMKAIFFADGPDIKPDVQFSPFTNVAVYPFVAQLLGLTPPRTDGSLRVLGRAIVGYVPPAGAMGDGTTNPVLIHRGEPEYSEAARKAKISGVVMVSLQVEADGTPSNVRVERGLGYGLDEKAVEAVRKYRFKPAMRNGQPVAVPVHIEIVFRLY